MRTALRRQPSGRSDNKKERLMSKNRNTHAASFKNDSSELVMQGVTIRLKFTAKQNEEVLALVRDILKTGWLRRKTA